MITKRTCGLPLICLICGDVARGINFDVMTCMSCKTFFRRHALNSNVSKKKVLFYFLFFLSFGNRLLVNVKWKINVK